MSSSVGERWTGSAAGDRVDPGFVRREADGEDAGVGADLGEGGVVAAGAADQRAARAAAARREQVAVGPAVEEGRAGEAADQAVGARAAVEAIGAGAGLEEVVLGAAADHVVALAAVDPDAADRDQRALGPRKRSLPGPRSAISQRAGPSSGHSTRFGAKLGATSVGCAGSRGPTARRAAAVDGERFGGSRRRRR